MRRGFSLVEMLVALVLISMLMSLGLLAYKQQLSVMKKFQTKGIERVLNFHQLRSLINSMFFYVVTDYDRFGNNMELFHQFFKGNAQEMTFITQNSLYFDGLCVARLACVEDKLIYQESKLYSPHNNYLEPAIVEGFYEKEFFHDLSECRFSYEAKERFVEELEDRLPLSVELYADMRYTFAVRNSDTRSHQRLGILNDEN